MDLDIEPLCSRSLTASRSGTMPMIRASPEVEEIRADVAAQIEHCPKPAQSSPRGDRAPASSSGMPRWCVVSNADVRGNPVVKRYPDASSRPRTRFFAGCIPPWRSTCGSRRHLPRPRGANRRSRMRARSGAWVSAVRSAGSIPAISLSTGVGLPSRGRRLHPSSWGAFPGRADIR
jgi:hypothetical protein